MATTTSIRSLLLLAMVAACGVALADRETDLAIGGGAARWAGMGGAGLALTDSPIERARLNPAVMAYQSRGFDFTIPSLGVTLDGLTYSELRDWFDEGDASGFDENDLGRFGRDFGDTDKRFGAHGDLGLSLRSFYIGVGAGASVETMPNPALQAWVRNGSQAGQLTGDERIDGYGFGAYAVQLGYGQFVPTGNESQRLALGGAVRFIRGYYSHHVADANDIDPINGDGGSTPAPEMNGDDTLNETGVAVDAALILASGPNFQSSFSAKLNNLVEPNIEFDTTLPDAGGVGPDYEPFRRSMDVGFAHRFERGLVFAADYIDVGNFVGASEIRLGLEQPLGKGFAVRAGYSNRTWLTAGLSFGGFHVAFGRELPVQFGTTFSF